MYIEKVIEVESKYCCNCKRTTSSSQSKSNDNESNGEWAHNHNKVRIRCLILYVITNMPTTFNNKFITIHQPECCSGRSPACSGRGAPSKRYPCCSSRCWQPRCHSPLTSTSNSNSNYIRICIPICVLPIDVGTSLPVCFKCAVPIRSGASRRIWPAVWRI